MKEYFDKPKIIGICADVNQGKSNLIYHMISELQKQGEFSLYTFGLKNQIQNATEFFSIDELEQIENSIIIIDETFNLFDLEDRKQKQLIETTLRLINHNNNILVVCALPENWKKFLGSKLDVLFFKKIKLHDLINGSRVKQIVTSYKGVEKGNSTMSLKIDETLVYDGKSYHKMKVPYYAKYDTKRKNVEIFVQNHVRKKSC